MIRKEYYQNPQYLKDLNDFNSFESELAIFADTKNIDRLKELNISKLWLIGAKEKDLNKILTYIKPQFIQLYQVLAKDLNALEMLTDTETIVLRWNTKSDNLWNLAYNKKLKSLVIEDFQKVNSINAITQTTNLEYLILEGGRWKPLNIDTLEPLSELNKLHFLRLANLKIKANGIRPIAKLKQLQELMLSNQFETKEYAYLSAKLPNTKCDYFNPYIRLDQSIGNNDTMVIGKRKPFLNYDADKMRIENYASDFYKMVEDFKNANDYY